MPTPPDSLSRPSPSAAAPDVRDSTASPASACADSAKEGLEACACERKPRRGVSDWALVAGRVVVAVALVFLAVHSFRAGRSTWVAERNLGYASARIDKQIHDQQTFRHLSLALSARPRDPIAHYFMGVGLLRSEMYAQGRPPNLDAVELAVRHLRFSLDTHSFPGKVYYYLGLAHQFGAGLSLRSNQLEMSRDFGSKAHLYFSRCARLDPTLIRDRQGDFWMGVAEQAYMANRADWAWSSLRRATANPQEPPSDALAAVRFEREQSAARALGSIPGVANALYARWQLDPENLAMWRAAAALDKTPGGAPAAAAMLIHMAQANPKAPQLRWVRENLMGLPPEPVAAGQPSAESIAPAVPTPLPTQVIPVRDPDVVYDEEPSPEDEKERLRQEYLKSIATPLPATDESSELNDKPSSPPVVESETLVPIQRVPSSVGDPVEEMKKKD